MDFRSLRPRLSLLHLHLAALACVAGSALRPSAAARIEMTDGRVYEGRVAALEGVVDIPRPRTEQPVPQLVLLIDDNLRRIFVPKRQAGLSEAPPLEAPENFAIKQSAARSGSRVIMIGQALRIDPFDEFGRRIFEMQTAAGAIAVVQGITEITPTWTRVEALQTEGKDFLLDQRIATSSIPRETLDRILKKQIDPKNLEHRLKIVRLYLQSELYRFAEEELQGVIRDFPDKKADYEATQRRLRQLYARRALQEITVRTAAGQHALAAGMLERFPSDGVAGETLTQVRERIDANRAEFERGRLVLRQIDEHLAQLTDSAAKTRLAPLRDEIVAELNINTLPRMAAFRQWTDDESLAVEEKLALAFSGWLVGSDAAVRKLPVALSMYEVRQLTTAYLGEPLLIKRDDLLQRMEHEEAALPETVALLLKHMKPPLDSAGQATDVPGMYQLEVLVLPAEPPTEYVVQLPPEYDPHRAYPTIVTLHGAYTSAEQQIDWWAGPHSAEQGLRLGQAARHGYIVIAPRWTRVKQKEYEYSAVEHGAVLGALRDACRRFSVDTSRVFLSGHSMGGDAAWDLGIAHPDLWAGVIPIVATADKYVHHYSQNARYVPLYLVGGELDGGRLQLNSRQLDRYLTYGYRTTVVEFKGRGHENFSDEIQNLFDWMGRYQRDFAPREFECHTMRPWDNFFWWVELDGLSPRTTVDPEHWPPPRGFRPALTKASINAKNGLIVTTGADLATVWLSPDFVDFSQPMTIRVNGQRARTGRSIDPDLTVLLEDARTRGDRRHPFWAKVEMPGSLINGRAVEAARAGRGADR